MRIFYGWAVVAAAFTVMMLGFGVAYSFAAFFDPLAHEFGGDRAAISLVFSICGLLYFMLGAVGGPAADALGTRLVIGLGICMIGIGLIAGIVWFILLAPVAAFVTQKLAIEREERHLEMRFGKKYRDYAKKVRRWI